MIYLAILVVLITEAAKVREHLWAGKDHTHWAKRPVVGRLAISDAFHLASAMSHYPIVLCLLWVSGAAWWHYLIVAILSQILWWQAKSSDGRDWPNKGEQLWNWIKRFKS